jgi:hypothetical protein
MIYSGKYPVIMFARPAVERTSLEGSLRDLTGFAMTYASERPTVENKTRGNSSFNRVFKALHNKHSRRLSKDVE